MSILPDGVVKSTTKNPKSLVIFGHTKQGKTTGVANLPDNLIIDLEGGTRFYDCIKVDVPEKAMAEDISTWQVLQGIVKELKEKKHATGKNPYKFITVDTVGHLQDVIMPYAISLYKASPVGKGFRGNALDLKALPMGAGWGPIREAFFNTIAMLNLYCDHLILIGHTKATTVKRRGEELTMEDIDVSGKMSQMLAGNADAIALIYRKKNQTILDFRTNENVAAGARIDHLREQEIVLYESDTDGNMTFHWDKIFI
jgi:hypothetical protein